MIAMPVMSSFNYGYLCGVRRLSLKNKRIRILKYSYIPNFVRCFNFAANEYEFNLDDNATCWSRAFHRGLIYLDLSHNVLETMQHNLSHLTELTELNLSHNKLRQVYPFVLDNLKVLHLSYNYLTVISANFFDKIRNLTELDLSNNHLTIFLPSSLPNKLYNLYLMKNRLTCIDNAILHNVKTITIAANPWLCSNMFHLLSYISNTKIFRPDCDEQYFKNGYFPVCIVTDDFYCDKYYRHDVTVVSAFYRATSSFNCEVKPEDFRYMNYFIKNNYTRS